MKSKNIIKMGFLILLSISIMACGVCNLSLPTDLISKVEEAVDFSDEEPVEEPEESEEVEEEILEEEPEVNEEESEVEPEEVIKPESEEKLSGSGREQAAEGDLQVLSYSHYMDGDWRYFVGEVRNNTSTAFKYVEIMITAYDGDGQEISTESAYSMINILGPGKISPFKISTDAWGAAESYTFEMESFEDDEVENSVEVINYSTFEDGDWFYVIGEVLNTSEDKAQTWVSVVITLLDDNDRVLNAVYNYVMKDFLNPGEKSPFNLQFSENWQDYARVEVQLEADDEEIQDPILELISSESHQENDYCYASGEIKNIGTEQFDLAKISIGFYDANDKLVGTTWTFADEDELMPNQTSTFDTSTMHCPGYDHHVVYLEE
ncbi:MAG: hypothetical protein JEZ06_21600 [Anaerolineaceae bacterium]|nr:hypothetical protein [Anaerolineaceae bacterium]